MSINSFHNIHIIIAKVCEYLNVGQIIVVHDALDMLIDPRLIRDKYFSEGDCAVCRTFFDGAHCYSCNRYICEYCISMCSNCDKRKCKKCGIYPECNNCSEDMCNDCSNACPGCSQLQCRDCVKYMDCYTCDNKIDH